MRILLLGGTSEARALANALAQSAIDAVYSIAGRTAQPLGQPLAQRGGGFGGVAGLQAYLESQSITHVIDATHPFAAQMSHNAVLACAQTVKLMRFERAPWQPQTGDLWRVVPDIEGALAALPQNSARVFLAIGKQNLQPFTKKNQHFYLLRLVDPAPQDMFGLHKAHAIIARGPFDIEGDLALLRDHQISHILAKNAGGSGACAKIEAARLLGLPVIMIDRPSLPSAPIAYSITEVFAWLGHQAPSVENLGV
jgi:precorrin-6A/cobalt-precorrin-6A reductase